MTRKVILLACLSVHMDNYIILYDLEAANTCPSKSVGWLECMHVGRM